MLHAPDRFVFENRTLADWLLQLVDEDSAKRRAASKVVTDRFFMSVELIPNTERGVEVFFEEFRAAVREAVNQPFFPSANFVQHLLSLNCALHESWCSKVSEDHARDAEADKAALAKLGEHPTEADKKRYVRRVWIQLVRDCKRIREEEPHEVFVTGAATTWVIESLGEELLPAADILREMFFSRHKANVASEAIARIGRKGLEFYDDLLEGLGRDDPNYHCAKALGSVLRAAPEKVAEILRLACEPNGSSRIAAISALGYCGRPATDAVPEVEAQLREMLNASDEKVLYAAVGALGTCGQTTQTVNCLLDRLDPARSCNTGEIIVALGNMARDPDRAVPRLTELLDSFEEYDPDWSYHGEHERVVQALSAFGPAAVSAVPALIRHIWTGPEKHWTHDQKLAERPEPDEAIIKLLGELGPAASSALPHLLEVQAEMKRRSAAEGETSEPLVESFIDIAINRIRGHEH